MTNAERKMLRRRALGVKPRAEYEAGGITKARPWERDGISRTHFYRLRRQIEWHQRQSASQLGLPIRFSTIVYQQG